MTLRKWKVCLKCSVCSNAGFDNSVGIVCFVVAPWLDCLHTLSACGKVGVTVADDAQLSPPILHLPRDSRATRLRVTANSGLACTIKIH